MIRNVAAGVLLGLAFSLVPACAGGFTPDARAKALDDIAAQIEKHYVFEDIAKKTAAEIRGWKSDPALLRAPDERSFASILTERLVKIDGHFNVTWEPPVAAPPTKSAQPAQPPSAAAFERRVASDNYGFEAVERRPGNIGYIKMRFFADFDTSLTGAKTPPARQAAEAALALVQNSSAVIFDLRGNGGGSPAMIDLLLSGFFGKKPLLLNRFHERKDNKTLDFTTLANYTGARRPNVPVFVLISGATGSAAEEFTYDVQTQKRGLIVGETSYGAANPGDEFDAGGGFNIFVSTGAAINPITHTNWERVGVKPDIAVPAAAALARAEELALQATIAHGGGKDVLTEAAWRLERLKAEENNLAPKASRDFVGVYGDRQVVLENGQLILKRGRFPEQRMISVGADAFALDTRPDLRLTFPRDAKGRVIAVSIADTDGDITTHPLSGNAKSD